MDNRDVLSGDAILRVAFVAHELSPYQGSECAGGWKLLLQLHERHPELEIDVYYADGPQHAPGKYAADIEQWERSNGKLNRAHFVCVPYGTLARRLISANFSRRKLQGGIGNPLLYFLAYRNWQRSVMSAVEKRHEARHYDLVHVANLITLREPGPWLKIDIPLVWGPTGGVVSVPRSFLRSLPVTVQAKELLRQLSWLLPSFRKRRIFQTIRKARHVFFFDRREAQSFGTHAKSTVLADSACGDVVVAASHDEGCPLHIVVVGQLIERKMPRLLLKALTPLPEIAGNTIVSFVGSGPLEDEIKDLASQAGLKSVKFVGSLAHDVMTGMYSSAHLLVHMSFREAGSHVVPEALSAGLPVICHAVGGLDYFVDSSCGVLIPLVDEATSVGALTAALIRLSEDRAELAKLSRGAIVRAGTLSWSLAADIVADVYRQVVSEDLQ